MSPTRFAADHIPPVYGSTCWAGLSASDLITPWVAFPAIFPSSSPATLKLYPGGRHEMLNETKRDEVTADWLDWIIGRFRAP